MSDPSHDWHLFDQEAGWEVRRVGDVYEVRVVRKGVATGHVTMTPEEFDLWREPPTDIGIVPDQSYGPT